MNQIANTTPTSSVEAFLSEYSNALTLDTISDALSTESTLIQSLGYLFTESRGITVIQQMRNEVKQALESKAYSWLQGACNVRAGYLFGSGVLFDSSIENVRTNPRSKHFLSSSWLYDMNLELMCSGNVFIVHNIRTNHFFMLDINEIENIVVDADDKGFITHILRRDDILNKSYYIGRNGVVCTSSERKSLTSKHLIRDDYEFYLLQTPKLANEPLSQPILLNALLYIAMSARYLNDVSRFKHTQMLFALKAKFYENLAVSTPTPQNLASTAAGFGRPALSPEINVARSYLTNECPQDTSKFSKQAILWEQMVSISQILVQLNF